MDRNKEFPRKVIQYYKEHGRDFRWRKEDTGIYEFIIAELLLQRTRAEDVEAFLEKFLKKYPNFETLARTEVVDLEREFGELGLQHSKAKRVKKMAKKLKGLKDEDIDPEDFRNLQGIGEYTVSALKCFYFNEDVPIIDSNVVRIIQRVFNLTSEPDPRRNEEVRKKAQSLLPGDKVQEYNYGLLDLGAKICKPRKPKCNECTLSSICHYGQDK